MAGRSALPHIWERALGSRSPLIPGELVVFGIWGLVAPYAGRIVDLSVATRPIVEVADHVIPGTVVLAVAVWSIVAGRRSLQGSLLVVGAGVWMTASHVPLLVQAARGDEDMSAALFHAIPGVLILLLGTVAAAVDAFLSPSLTARPQPGTPHLSPTAPGPPEPG